VVVANSIDSALAGDFLADLKENHIDGQVIKASDLTQELRMENRLIIILGGPDAPEGVGKIVREVLSDASLEDKYRGNGAMHMHVKRDVWTTRFPRYQKVIIVGGSNRLGTQKAEKENSAKVKFEAST
jgi:hypothetical protein